jgi:DNA-binding PadR family transcriptional regulator
MKSEKGRGNPRRRKKDDAMGEKQRVRRGHRRGGRHSRRMFDHGELRYVVLSLIAERPRHGYEIIKAIEDRMGGAYSPSPGVIYPTLTLLEELGHVTVAEADGKNLHTITAEGTGWLDANRAAVEVAMARMDKAGKAQSGGPAPEVVRATESLRMALRRRHAGGPLNEEQSRAVAAALDAARMAVEKA